MGAIEPEFRRELLEKLGLSEEIDTLLSAPPNEPSVHRRLEQVFQTRSRSEWEQVFRGSDACVSPVLDVAEAPLHEHNQANQTFYVEDGVAHPAPAVRFSRTPALAPGVKQRTWRSTNLAAWKALHAPLTHLRDETDGLSPFLAGDLCKPRTLFEAKGMM